MFWDKITYVPKFFAQIRYFSNVLGTNTIFRNILDTYLMRLKWFQPKSHIFWIFWGANPKHSVCTPKYSKVIWFRLRTIKSIEYLRKHSESIMLVTKTFKMYHICIQNIRKVSNFLQKTFEKYLIAIQGFLNLLCQNYIVLQCLV